MSLTENSNQVFLPGGGGVQQTRKIAHISQFGPYTIIVQALISVQALVFDLAQLTCQKRFDCRNAILGPSAILLGTSYS